MLGVIVNKIGFKSSSMVLSLVLGMSVLLAACGTKEETLRELEKLYLPQSDPAYVEVNFCTKPAEVIKTNTKYIYILDTSGSNQQNFLLNPDGSIATPLQILTTLATDPTGIRRYGSLLQTLQNAPDNDPNRFYALIEFSDDARLVRGLTSDKVSFQSTIQTRQNSLNDQGATNYLSALDMAYNIINADIQAANAAALANPQNIVANTYIIVMASDGFPIMSINAGTNPPTVEAQSKADIIQKVADIVDLQITNPQVVDSISFNTVYYFITGNEDPNALQLLKDMAEKKGNGVNYNVGTGQVVDFSLFSAPPKLLKYSIDQIYVLNASTTWWIDGKLHHDLDKDGIPDEIEPILGSNYSKVDSDANGVSDFVEYKTLGNGKACLNNSCSAAGAKNYRALNANVGGCSDLIPLSTSGGVIFKDSDKDGLNDCEERVLGNGGGVNEPDTNFDGIPDFEAFKNGIAFKAGTNATNANPDQDNMFALDEIKFSMPPTFPNNQLLNAVMSKYDLISTFSNSSQDCFKLTVTDLPRIGSENSVRVYLSQKTAVVLNKRTFDVAEKSFVGSEKILEIHDKSAEPAIWR